MFTTYGCRCLNEDRVPKVIPELVFWCVNAINWLAFRFEFQTMHTKYNVCATCLLMAEREEQQCRIVQTNLCLYIGDVTYATRQF